MSPLSSSTSDVSLATNILNSLHGVLLEAEQNHKPLEIDPARGQLFELFVTAHGAGYLEEDADVDLSADGLCREFAARWGLDAAARQSFQQQEKMSPAEVARLRLLWSLMRMWMEWTYAWQRWPEFHEGRRPADMDPTEGRAGSESPGSEHSGNDNEDVHRNGNADGESGTNL